MKLKPAKPILYVLIGSACVYALLWIGALVWSLTDTESFGFIPDGVLGIMGILLGMMLFALAIMIMVLVAGALCELGKWIMEELL